MRFESRNPFTGKLLAVFQLHTDAEIDAILDSGTTSFQRWRKVRIERRCQLAIATADILRRRLDELAVIVTQEMGKPISQARSEIEKCASLCDYYGSQSESFLQDELISMENTESFVTYQPLGTILGIMPWNFPFWQVIRFAIPTLTAGNVCVLKHAPNVPQCADAIMSVFAEAGYPPHVFQNIRTSIEETNKVISDSRIAAVSLTGSTGAGRAVASTAGAALKKAVLELGGNDAYLVLRDADLDAAVHECVTSRVLNSGQSCIAAKRFIVDSEISRPFVAKVAERMGALMVGDPENESTDIGPLARLDLRDNLDRQVSESVELGAVAVLGGDITAEAGLIYPPTVLTEVVEGMPAYHEELFGPVAAIIVADNEQHAISIANDTSFGLGAAVFTSDQERGRQIARDELDAGSCFVNAFVRSDPRIPFGGIKDSGMGRELASWGIREFTNVKTVVVA